MVLADHAQSVVRDEHMVHPREHIRLVVEGADVQRLHAAAFGQGLQADAVEARRAVPGPGLLDGGGNMSRSIHSGTMIINVQSHRDLSRDAVKASMSAARHRPSNGMTT